jgi:site-specific DNA-methyltransferase (adenine-specific)
MYSKAYNDDCVHGMKLLEDESIDLVITSPPYDNIRDYNGYSFDYKATFVEMFRILKWGGWLCG